MSLTNPVFNDIIAKELTLLTKKFDSLEKEFQSRINQLTLELDSYNNKLLKQDTKIELIHRLFNTIKNESKDHHDTGKEVIDIKKINSEIETSLNEKYSNFIDRMTSMMTKYNIQKDSIISMLQQNHANMNEAISNIKSNINHINKNVSDINYRLNGLERRYKNLDESINYIEKDNEIK